MAAPADGQLSLFDAPQRTDPITCPHREDFPLDGISRCMAHEGTFVGCTKSICGDPPACAYEEPDNGPEACARRVAWMEEHKKGDSC